MVNLKPVGFYWQGIKKTSTTLKLQERRPEVLIQASITTFEFLHFNQNCVGIDGTYPGMLNFGGSE